MTTLLTHSPSTASFSPVDTLRKVAHYLNIKDIHSMFLVSKHYKSAMSHVKALQFVKSVQGVPGSNGPVIRLPCTRRIAIEKLSPKSLLSQYFSGGLTLHFSSYTTMDYLDFLNTYFTRAIHIQLDMMYRPQSLRLEPWETIYNALTEDFDMESWDIIENELIRASGYSFPHCKNLILSHGCNTVAANLPQLFPSVLHIDISSLKESRNHVYTMRPIPESCIQLDFFDTEQVDISSSIKALFIHSSFNRLFLHATLLNNLMVLSVQTHEALLFKDKVSSIPNVTYLQITCVWDHKLQECVDLIKNFSSITFLHCTFGVSSLSRFKTHYITELLSNKPNLIGLLFSVYTTDNYSDDEDNTEENDEDIKTNQVSSFGLEYDDAGLIVSITSEVYLPRLKYIFYQQDVNSYRCIPFSTGYKKKYQCLPQLQCIFEYTPRENFIINDIKGILTPEMEKEEFVTLMDAYLLKETLKNA